MIWETVFTTVENQATPQGEHSWPGKAPWKVRRDQVGLPGWNQHFTVHMQEPEKSPPVEGVG